MRFGGILIVSLLIISVVRSEVTNLIDSNGQNETSLESTETSTPSTNTFTTEPETTTATTTDAPIETTTVNEPKIIQKNTTTKLPKASTQAIMSARASWVPPFLAVLFVFVGFIGGILVITRGVAREKILKAIRQMENQEEEEDLDEVLTSVEDMAKYKCITVTPGANGVWDVDVVPNCQTPGNCPQVFLRFLFNPQHYKPPPPPPNWSNKRIEEVKYYWMINIPAELEELLQGFNRSQDQSKENSSIIHWEGIEDMSLKESSARVEILKVVGLSRSDIDQNDLKPLRIELKTKEGKRHNEIAPQNEIFIEAVRKIMEQIGR